jgi:hypothetical protein
MLIKFTVPLFGCTEKQESMNLSSERALIRKWQATYLDSTQKYYKNMQSKKMMEIINLKAKITVHVYLIPY